MVLKKVQGVRGAAAPPMALRSLLVGSRRPLIAVPPISVPTPPRLLSQTHMQSLIPDPHLGPTKAAFQRKVTFQPGCGRAATDGSIMPLGCRWLKDCKHCDLSSLREDMMGRLGTWAGHVGIRFRTSLDLDAPGEARKPHYSGSSDNQQRRATAQSPMEEVECGACKNQPGQWGAETEKDPDEAQDTIWVEEASSQHSSHVLYRCGYCLLTPGPPLLLLLTIRSLGTTICLGPGDGPHGTCQTGT